jgi:hypothetical protein
MKHKEFADARGVLKRLARSAALFLPVLMLTSLSSIRAQASVRGNTTANKQPGQITITGTLTSGGNLQTFPIARASVFILEVQHGASVVVGHAETNASGHFSVDVKRRDPDSLLYALAKRGSRLKFMADLGTKPLTTVHINELTTIAASYAYAQFFKNGLLAGPKLSLQIAHGMAENIFDSTTGAASTVISTAPNAHQTNAWSMLGTLGNILAACAQNLPGACESLFKATTIERTPSDTLEAILNIVHNPSANVAELFALGEASVTYSPALTAAQGPGQANDPLLRLNAWTMALKFNHSGNEATCPFGGPGNAVIDDNGYVWITNNVVQGTGGSARCIIVLKPNGEPANGANNTPGSPVTGGGIVGQGFGITRDLDGNIWSGNFGWGGVLPNPSGILGKQNKGSVSEFSPVGVPLSPNNPPDLYNGFIGGTDRVQGMAGDQFNNVWMASFANDSAVAFPNGDPHRALVYYDGVNLTPFGTAVDQNNNGWVSFRNSDTVVKLRLNGNKLEKQFAAQLDAGSSPKGIAVDSFNNTWVAAGGNNTVYLISNDGTSVTGYPADGLNGPWGLSVDARDNIWVSNFGHVVDAGNIYSISELCGETGQCPAGLKTGDAISPKSGYNLPSGGDQVLLASGSPLYGPSKPPSYKPLMRATSANIDRAGNIWVANNWKPNTFNDVFSNPGGDAMVVFIGLGAPTQFGAKDCPSNGACSPH